MTPRQRFMAAVQGQQVDRVPVSAWMHFGAQFWPPAEVARLHADFARAHQWDFVKVMADYRLPMPPGPVVNGSNSADVVELLEHIGHHLDHAACFAAQRELLEALRQQLGPQAVLLDTGYDPWNNVLRNLGRDLEGALLQHPSHTLAALARVCEATCRHVQQLQRMGVDGYFYATNAAIAHTQPRGLRQDVYERFVRPFDLAILDAAQGMVRVLHAHGTGIDLARLAGYPFEVIHLSDRFAGNPSLADLRRWTDRCVMGGIDEQGFTSASLASLAVQLTDAVQQAGPQGLILAPGCAVPTSSAARSLQFVRDFSEHITAFR
ncbi:MAG: hypothetical protein K2Q97_16355 [Burkholderiaceae bacterium]|nr:hypothetical protein [Burkholderiaceae bacterium]